MKMIPRRRALIQSAEKEIARIVGGALDIQKEALVQHVSKIAKADSGVPASVFAFTDEEMARIFRVFEKVYLDGAERAAKQLLDFKPGVMEYAIEEFRDRAADWAAANGAKLISGISNTTRTFVNNQISQGIRNGDSVGQVADRLKSAYTFSQSRAQTIANTETARADVEGNMGSYREADVQKKRWILGAGACEICEANAAQGAINFDDDFQSGDSAPPSHPNCRCDILPVL